jgi:hypothetical protein
MTRKGVSISASFIKLADYNLVLNEKTDSDPCIE